MFKWREQNYYMDVHVSNHDVWSWIIGTFIALFNICIPNILDIFGLIDIDHSYRVIVIRYKRLTLVKAANIYFIYLSLCTLLVVLTLGEISNNIPIKKLES